MANPLPKLLSTSVQIYTHSGNRGRSCCTWNYERVPSCATYRRSHIPRTIEVRAQPPTCRKVQHRYVDSASPNPESELLRLRQHLDSFANIRPCVFHSRSLVPLSPLKQSVVEGIKFILLRENIDGAYFGTKGEEPELASDSWAYSRREIERCARVAAALATSLGKDGRGNGGPATMWASDKANVIASGRLWRKVTREVFEQEFSHIKLKHQLADSLSMMVKNPKTLNGIIHTDNTFGDISSDQAGGVVGTLGLLPSASLCGVPDGKTRCNGIHEPVHGLAPDISGKSIVNPVAGILSRAMILRYSFNVDAEAAAIEAAVEKLLGGEDVGGLEICIGDLGGAATTKEVSDAVCRVLEEFLTKSTEKRST